MKSMFPVEQENEERVLCGLEITKVVSSLTGTILKLETVNKAGEMHIIEFKHGVMVVDDDTILILNAGV